MKPLYRKRTMVAFMNCSLNVSDNINPKPFFHSKAVCGGKYRKRQISFNVVLGKFGSLSVMCYKNDFFVTDHICV